MVMLNNSETEARRAAWSSVITADYLSALNFARKRVRNSDFAEDIVVAAAVKLLNVLPDHRRINSRYRRNYWFRVVVNQTRDHLREHGKEAAMFIQLDAPLNENEDGEEQYLQVPDPCSNPEEILEMKEEAESLRARFESRRGKLTEREQALLKLGCEGLTNDEIAVELGENVKVIRVEINALKSKLRYRLQKPETND